jgi:hypothetical protein
MARRAETGRVPTPGAVPRAAPARDDKGAAAPSRAAPGVTPEPGTAWALWPTFMRRTLAEEEVLPRHRVPERAG